MSEELKRETLLCPYCKAGPFDGEARTVSARAECLTVTWHRSSCPHYAADRILAGYEA
ncbi:hypothetical protein [Streptomyces sp. NPDC051567]|uniref:hypothetical protein n=1 Tax=Streptomyces sp. NPDC051567 TaxID=3365660 RepID=UPI0037AF5644